MAPDLPGERHDVVRGGHPVQDDGVDPRRQRGQFRVEVGAHVGSDPLHLKRLGGQLRPVAQRSAVDPDDEQDAANGGRRGGTALRAPVHELVVEGEVPRDLVRQVPDRRDGAAPRQRPGRRGVRRQPRQRVRERRRAPRGDDESVVPVPDRLLGSEGVGADDREPRAEGLACHDRVGLPHNGGENEEVVGGEDALDLLAPVLRVGAHPVGQALGVAPVDAVGVEDEVVALPEQLRGAPQDPPSLEGVGASRVEQSQGAVPRPAGARVSRGVLDTVLVHPDPVGVHAVGDEDVPGYGGGGEDDVGMGQHLPETGRALLLLAAAGPAADDEAAEAHLPVDEELVRAEPPEVVHGEDDPGPRLLGGGQEAPPEGLDRVEVDDVGAPELEPGAEGGLDRGVVVVAAVGLVDPRGRHDPGDLDAAAVVLDPGLERGAALVQVPGEDHGLVAGSRRRPGESLGDERPA